MTVGKNGGELLLDDFAIKAMIVLSILITFAAMFAAIYFFLVIREYQEERFEEFEKLSQFDQIDYLIHLINEQEKILHMNLKGQTTNAVEEKLDRYLDLNKEFSGQLDNLHEMMAGLSKKEFDVKMDGAMKSTNKFPFGTYN